MEIDSIICVLGWEERFLLSLELVLEKHTVKRLILISFIDYKSMIGVDVSESRIRELVEKYNIALTLVEMNYSDSIENWKILDDFFEENDLGSEVMINTTTFPRETIWMLLFFLKKKLSYVHYVYFKPKAYDKEWLTKNHKNPRLLFKHSGIFDLNQQLVLFIITGFDSNRLDTTVDFYEPSKVILFCQEGPQFDNLERNIGLSDEKIAISEKVIFDSYNVNEATRILNDQITKYHDCNIIISSQGPKTSALSTYKSYLFADKRIALAYVPAKDFSSNYSTGIDPIVIEGKIEFND